MNKVTANKYTAKMRAFLKESKYFAGITMRGCYTLSTETFLTAFNEYLLTENNELDSHARMSYILWGAERQPCESNYFSKEDIKYAKELLENKHFWNIDYFWSDEEKRTVKRHIAQSESHYKNIESYEYRRNEANAFITNKKVRADIFRRDGKKCKKCGSTEKISIDHIIPIASGGDNSIENLQVLCVSCNSKKGHRL